MIDVEKLRAERLALSDHEAMADAQAGCVPCKLCGGKAIITDAGEGAGYYIRCENSGAFRAAQGCMVTDSRLGGWAYNVMDWWNRLHSVPSILALAEREKQSEQHRNDLYDKVMSQVTEIGALKAEVKRMREALESIAKHNTLGTPTAEANIARRALGEEKVT